MPLEAVQRCLRRIRERESDIRAWVEVAPQEPLGSGPLDGLPFGAKDIFETRGLLTGYGSPLFAGRRGHSDAALVIMLRRKGAVLLGKTQTTAFAYFDPAPTRNPRNLSHTPGGSSSGSAAAVADGMAEFALGTQTQGSVIRPASYCGVVGFKPTHGLLPMDGVLPFAPSLDTAGLFTRTAGEMSQLWAAMGFEIGAGDAAPMAALPLPDDIEEPMKRCFLECMARLGVNWVQPPVSPVALFESVRCINDYEGARTHRNLYAKHGAGIGAKLAELIERGLHTPVSDYRNALDHLAAARLEMEDFFAAHPVLLWPAAPGPAPEGLASTGSPRMNGAFTGLGVPAITVPMPVGERLPLGLQLVARKNGEALLLDTASLVENVLSS
jgi:Asp-tRNA(Asn)/Glu-tRNA(Gln) amidotransferase A subunit family amidase